MLVGPGILLHGRNVQPTLVAERPLPDIGLAAVRAAVQQFVQHMRYGSQPFELRRRNPGLVACLQGQGRNHRNQVGIAATLTQPVDRTLDLPDPRLDRGQGIGNRVFGIVMGVDAEMRAGDMPRDLGYDAIDLVRQGAAVGIAQHDPARAGVVGGLQAVQGEFRVGLVAVEEMLGVEHNLVEPPARQRDALADHGDIFLERRLEGDIDMKVPGLADHADGSRLRRQDGGQARIVLGAASRPARHPEGGEFRRLQRRRRLEERVVGRVRSGPAAFDIVDAQRIERFGDHCLVPNGKIDAPGLRAVPQRGVEQIDALFVGAHAASPNRLRQSGQLPPAGGCNAATRPHREKRSGRLPPPVPRC